MPTMTSRAFNQDTSQAKKAAAEGPVIITDRGKPAHVLMTFDADQALTKGGPTLGEALYMPGVVDIDLESELPSRAGDFTRDVDLS
jgi:hypothetical protein